MKAMRFGVVAVLLAVVCLLVVTPVMRAAPYEDLEINQWRIRGTRVTATAAELNLLHGASGYAVMGGDATTGLMVLKGAVTSGTNATQTVTFGTVFGAAPIVVCTYTEDPGDVRPIFVTSVTASNFVANITADKNYGYIAVGTRP